MPTKPVKQFTAWSYSRLGDYLKCPAMAKYKHLDRLPVKESAALANGNAVHKTAEEYVIAKTAPKVIPTPLIHFKEEFTNLRKLRRKKDVSTEAQWCVTAKWEGHDWFGPAAWCRAKVDVFWLDKPTHMEIVDHKSGKIWPDNVEQLHQYATLAFSMQPKLQTVRAALWYLDQGEIVDREYKRADLPVMQQAWNAKVAPMLADKTFAPRPGNHCRWCDFSKERGGPCKY